MASTMAMSLDEQHAAYEQQQRAELARIGLDGHRAACDPQQASSSETVPQRGRRTYTEVCGVFSPAIHDPPLVPRGKDHVKNFQYHCPRCDTTYSRSHAVKQHFPRCVQLNGNPDSLRWCDHESNDFPGTRKQEDMCATVTPSKRKRRGNGLGSLLASEPKALGKVAKWAAMAAEKQAATVASTLNNPNGIGSWATSYSTGVPALTVNTSRHVISPVVNKPAVTAAAVPKNKTPLATPAARDHSTPAPKRQRPNSQTPKKPRQPDHNELTARLFNSAGVLMPSIPGITFVAERLFDQGEIMSLGPSGSHDGYYPDGEPTGGSFLLWEPCGKKRKRDSDA